MAERLIAVLMLGYLLWRGLQAFRDFHGGCVQIRLWWFIPWWQRKSEPMLHSHTLERGDEPAAFWFWTFLQAAAIVLLLFVFSAILVSP